VGGVCCWAWAVGFLDGLGSRRRYASWESVYEVRCCSCVYCNVLYEKLGLSLAVVAGYVDVGGGGWVGDGDAE
jgi:hypothetical protein